MVILERQIIAAEIKTSSTLYVTQRIASRQENICFFNSKTDSAFSNIYISTQFKKIYCSRPRKM
jgi:hypothetical protein